ncbi:MAG TPA: hypothetical protein VKZ61_04515 [Thermomicrobiales bacterium]|nr:hypothetical protein [Thermomicrobiales bacterium]
MAKLQRHRVDGTYYTTRYDETGVVTRRIHPDGIVFLKRRGVVPGEDISPFAMAELVRGNWLYTEEQAASLPGINWAPDWNEIGDAPAPKLRSALRASGSLTQVDVPLSLAAMPAVAPVRPSGKPMWGTAGFVLLLAFGLYLGLLM